MTIKIEAVLDHSEVITFFNEQLKAKGIDSTGGTFTFQVLNKEGKLVNVGEEKVKISFNKE